MKQRFEVYCYGCPELISISISPKTTLIDCSMCPKLTEILLLPNYDSCLMELDCSGCSELVEIPIIKGLRRLDCSKCVKLKRLFEPKKEQSVHFFYIKLLVLYKIVIIILLRFFIPFFIHIHIYIWLG